MTTEYTLQRAGREPGLPLAGRFKGREGSRHRLSLCLLHLLAEVALAFPKVGGVWVKGVDSEGGEHRWPAGPTPASSSSRPSAC